MSLWVVFYLGCLLYTGSMFCIMVWWDRRKDSAYTLTLQELMQGIVLTVVPLLNTIVAIGLSVWFITEVAPKIRLLGPAK